MHSEGTPVMAGSISAEITGDTIMQCVWRQTASRQAPICVLGVRAFGCATRVVGSGRVCSPSALMADILLARCNTEWCTAVVITGCAQSLGVLKPVSQGCLHDSPPPPRRLFNSVPSLCVPPAAPHPGTVYASLREGGDGVMQEEEKTLTNFISSATQISKKPG